MTRLMCEKSVCLLLPVFFVLLQVLDAFFKLKLHLMGAFAEFERSLIKFRQAEGIRKANERGVYKGRKKKIVAAEIYALTDADHSQHGVAEQMGIARMSVYRALKKRRLFT